MARAVVRGNYGVRPSPFKLTFAVTDRCNSRCRACGIWHRGCGEELTLGEIDAFFAANGGFSWVDLTGGEFFLRPDCREIVRSLLARMPRLYHLHIPTNGVDPGRTVEAVRAILRLSPPWFTVTLSLDGPPALHDRLRGVAGNWESVMAVHEALSPLVRGRFRLFFGLTLTPWNPGTLAATLAAVRERRPRVTLADFHLNIAHRSGHYYNNAGVGDGDSVITGNDGDTDTVVGLAGTWMEDIRLLIAAKQRLDPVDFLERRYLAGVERFLRERKCPERCRSLALSLFVGATGEVYPCIIWDRPLGNLRESAFRLGPILESPRAREALTEIAMGGCPHCWTPCEAYPTLLGNGLPFSRRGGAPLEAG
ncbi:MAG: radical SAM protein [Magnetococcales bacterium]|nr:radical SAM protein [Magnetococcales bacterium]